MEILKKLSILTLVFIFIFGLTACSAYNKGDSSNAGDGLNIGDFIPSIPSSPSNGADAGDSLVGGIVGSDTIISGTSPSPDKVPSYDLGASDDVVLPDMDTGEGGVESGDKDDTTTDGTENNESVILPSGMITAGAWCDNDYYDMWIDMFAQGEDSNGKFYQYSFPDDPWKVNSLNRIKVWVKSADTNVAGANVSAYGQNGQKLFSAVTNANGVAYIFTSADSGTIVVNNDANTSTEFSIDNRDIIIETETPTEKLNVIDIMFVVDVTGSMGDELNFLKAELTDVVRRISANNTDTVINLALLFYRDNNDAVPFDYYDFENVTNSDSLAAQQDRLNRQSASGGGDYPEAVDKALEIAMNKQWSTGATTKIIFHVLDAPPHSNNNNVKTFKSAINTAAEKGIRICPIICSGAANLTEYLMREAAITTGGTFVYVTDDSGIGNSHHDPDLPNVTIELLNSLMVRLVNGYHTGEFAPPVFWKEDPALAQ